MKTSELLLKLKKDAKPYKELVKSPDKSDNSINSIMSRYNYENFQEILQASFKGEDEDLDDEKMEDLRMTIIRSKLRSDGRTAIYDLTGLAGGFPLLDGDIALLETYAGPAVFDDEIQRLGREHLGGEKILALNRTSSGILAAILALVQKGDEIVHYLPKSPAHPSIPRSAELVGASYM